MYNESMKKINQYKFTNGKVMEVSYMDKRAKKKQRFPSCDNLFFRWSDDNGKSFEGLGIRPDEALIIAKMLIDAVYKVTGGYEEKLLKFNKKK